MNEIKSKITVFEPGVYKCSDCQHKKRYTTGRDEYPGLTTIEYCSKQHWEGGNPEPDPDQDFTIWDDCKDFVKTFNFGEI